MKIAFLEKGRKKMRSSTTFQSPKNAVMFLIVINEAYLIKISLCAIAKFHSYS